MDSGRRSFCLAVPFLALPSAFAADPQSLSSFIKPFADLPVKESNGNASRPILDGTTYASHHIEVHETTLAPGNSPHPPHRHEHEELFLMVSGTLTVTINGKTASIGAGSAAFVHSNELHGVHNDGSQAAQYFVLAAYA